MNHVRPLVEFCVNNLTGDVLEAKIKLESSGKYDVLEYGCLGYCGICAAQPYAMVNGEVITADSADELLQKIEDLPEEDIGY